MNVNQIKKDYEPFENFDSLSFPSFGRFYLSFISKDLVDPIICFKLNSTKAGNNFKIKINDESYDISSNCFPTITSNRELQVNDNISLQDMDLLTPLFQGEEFCITLENINLFMIVIEDINDNDLQKIHDFANDYFNQSKKLIDLCELEEQIFDLNLKYFIDIEENEGLSTQCTKFDKNYIARFIYELGCSKSILSPQIAKFAKDLCDIIDSKVQKTENNKSLRDTISEYFILRLKLNGELDKFSNSSDQLHFFLYRQFYDHDLIDKDELLEPIFALENFKGLLWFIDILPKHMERLMKDLIGQKGISALEKLSPYIDQISANNFEKFKQIILNPESENILTKVIRSDDVDQLQMLLAGQKANPNVNNFNSKVGRLLFEVTEFLDNCKLINYAAFFGSVKCFKYLLMNGAQIQPRTIEFAIYGENTEIIRTIGHIFQIEIDGINYSIKANKNNIFDWLYDDRKPKNPHNYTNYTKNAVRFYNFHAFLKVFSQNSKWKEIKNISIKYGNYEILKLINMLSKENADEKIPIFDLPTYNALQTTKYKMKNYPSHLKYYQIENNYELFQIFIKYKESKLKASNKDSISKLERWFLTSVNTKKYFIVKFLTGYYDFSDYINNYSGGFLRSEVVDQNYPSILYLILQNNNVNINATPLNSNGTAFTLATWEGYIACIRILYDRGGVDINALGNIGETPLTGAILSEKPSVVNLLLTFDDIEINKPNSSGFTPFQAACQHSTGFKSLEILLERPDLEFDMEEILYQFQKAFFANEISLMKAIYNHPKFDSNQLSIESLCKKDKIIGVEPQTICALSLLISNQNMSFKKLVRRVSDPVLYIELSNSERYSDILFDSELYPFHYAIKANKPETIDYLLQYSQIDVNAIYPKRHITPLIQLILSNDVDTDVFNRFLSCDRLDLSLNESVCGGETNFLNLFIENQKYLELTIYLKRKIKSIDMVTDDLFIFLAKNHFYEYIMLLIENGYRNELINYALAESIKSPETNNFFKKIQLKKQNEQNDQELSYTENSTFLFDYLIDLHNKKEISLDLNYRNFNDEGKTALMESIDFDHPEIFDILLKIGKLDINIKDNNNMTAYDYAESQTINGKCYYLDVLLKTQLVDLLDKSYADDSMSRIDFLIDSKKDLIFENIMNNLPKEELIRICQKVDLSLLINNIGSFKTTSLLHFIDFAGKRILETVNDNGSFLYQFLNFYMLNECGGDELNFKSTDILEKFMKMGFDINSIDKNGDTLVMSAIKNQKFEALLTLILIDDLDLQIKNKDGKDAFQITKELGHISVLKILERIPQSLNSNN